MKSILDCGTSLYLHFRLLWCVVHFIERIVYDRLEYKMPSQQFTILIHVHKRKISEILHYMAKVWVREIREKKVLKIDLYLEKLWHHNTIFLSTDDISVWWISKWNIYIFITKYKYKYKTHVDVDVSAYRLCENLNSDELEKY